MPSVFVCLLCTLVVAVPAAGQDVPTGSRARLITALERLMMTGEPHQTSVDDGQLLQLAVDDAIRGGDAEVERLAVRAAAPLFAAVSSPLIKTGQPATLGIGSRQVLKVPRPIPFEAIVDVSVDGHDYWEAGTLNNSKGSSVSAKLPDYALAPGVHRVRVRARMTFSGRQSVRWKEERLLPEVTYAVYDPREPSGGRRRFCSRPRLSAQRHSIRISPMCRLAHGSRAFSNGPRRSDRWIGSSTTVLSALEELSLRPPTAATCARSRISRRRATCSGSGFAPAASASWTPVRCGP